MIAYKSNYKCIERDQPVTPDSITVSIINPAEEVIINNAIPGLDNGIYSYQYAFTSSDIEGIWTFRWTTRLGSLVSTFDETVNVTIADSDIITDFNATLLSNKTLKAGTYGEAIEFQLTKQGGEALDLMNFDTIKIFMKTSQQTETKEFECQISDPTEGLVYYIFKEGDLDAIGLWKIEVEIATETVLFVSENRVGINVVNRIKELN